ncbi:MAG: hypothetical protein IT497_01360, partial [Ottowia sp.]|nr:hypothetical protein [Ottowia sp.]
GRKAWSIAARQHVFDGNNANNITRMALYTFRISAAAKKDIRHQLEKMFGYRHATIYPDYSGFSQFGIQHLKNF